MKLILLFFFFSIPGFAKIPKDLQNCKSNDDCIVMSCFCGVLAGNKNKKDEIKKYCLDTASKSIFGSSQAGNNPEYFATFCQQNTCVTFDKYSKNGGRILPVK